jgi:membrane protein CcdC involved in cytochrome C biogenesis
VTLFALFVWRECVAPASLIDLALFGHRAFTAGVIGVSLSYALVFGMFFLMSFALIHGFHNSALLAGSSSPSFRWRWVSPPRWE